MAVRIGELLLKEKKITPTQLQEALGTRSPRRQLAMNLCNWASCAMRK